MNTSPTANNAFSGANPTYDLDCLLGPVLGETSVVSELEINLTLECNLDAACMSNTLDRAIETFNSQNFDMYIDELDVTTSLASSTANNIENPNSLSPINTSASCSISTEPNNSIISNSSTTPVSIPSVPK